MYVDLLTFALCRRLNRQSMIRFTLVHGHMHVVEFQITFWGLIVCYHRSVLLTSFPNTAWKMIQNVKTAQSERQVSQDKKALSI